MFKWLKMVETAERCQNNLVALCDEPSAEFQYPKPKYYSYEYTWWEDQSFTRVYSHHNYLGE